MLPATTPGHLRNMNTSLCMFGRGEESEREGKRERETDKEKRTL